MVQNVNDSHHLWYPTVEWSVLVEKIKREDPTGMEMLYALFSKGIRYLLCRQFGPQDLDDRVHDCFLVVVEAIQRGVLREPDRLMGFVRTIVRRKIAGYIKTAVEARARTVNVDATDDVADTSENPERFAMTRQEQLLASEALKDISVRDREILTRFYIHAQSQTLICREMNLTNTQFRLLKSRAKARFGERGRAKRKVKAEK